MITLSPLSRPLLFLLACFFFFFFFIDTATTEIYTLSLHDALPITGVAGAATLVRVDFTSAAGSSPQTRTRTGHFDVGVPDFVYLPVQVPSGVRQLDVTYSYDRPPTPPGVPGNAMDIGIFDERGHQLGAGAGFRGWSGGSRDGFSISNPEATPGYLPGPI